MSSVKELAILEEIALHTPAIPSEYSDWIGSLQSALSRYKRALKQERRLLS